MIGFAKTFVNIDQNQKNITFTPAHWTDDRFISQQKQSNEKSK